MIERAQYVCMNFESVMPCVFPYSVNPRSVHVAVSCKNLICLSVSVRLRLSKLCCCSGDFPLNVAAVVTSFVVHGSCDNNPSFFSRRSPDVDRKDPPTVICVSMYESQCQISSSLTSSTILRHCHHALGHSFGGTDFVYQSRICLCDPAKRVGSYSSRREG
jgi:hypothetical protein